MDGDVESIFDLFRQEFVIFFTATNKKSNETQFDRLLNIIGVVGSSKKNIFHN